MTRPIPGPGARWIAGSLAAASLVGLAGCATPEPVTMRNPNTNEIVDCPAGYRSFLGGFGYRKQEDCVRDYQQKGFEQIFGPTRDK